MLLGASAQQARRLVVFSYPPRDAGMRLFFNVANLVFRLLRTELRWFAHPPAAMIATVEDRVLQQTFAHTGLMQVAALSRSQA